MKQNELLRKVHLGVLEPTDNNAWVNGSATVAGT
jgi:hypothetical protein